MDQRHSQVINDVISKKPNWWIRWGTTGVLVIVVLLIVFASIIKYPEMIRKQLELKHTDVYFGEGKFLQEEAAKIRVGQDVISFPDRSPKNKGVILKGKVISIYKKSEDGLCTVKIAFEPGQESDFYKSGYSNGLILNTAIIVSKHSVLQHIIDHLAIRF